MMPSSHSLFNSSFTLSNFATRTQRVKACTGVTLGSSSMCRGVPRGFLRPGFNTFELWCSTSSFVSFHSGGGDCILRGISSSTAFASSASIFK